MSPSVKQTLFSSVHHLSSSSSLSSSSHSTSKTFSLLCPVLLPTPEKFSSSRQTAVIVILNFPLVSRLPCEDLEEMKLISELAQCAPFFLITSILFSELLLVFLRVVLFLVLGLFLLLSRRDNLHPSRELVILSARKTKSLFRLDSLRSHCSFIPLTATALCRAHIHSCVHTSTLPRGKGQAGEEKEKKASLASPPPSLPVATVKRPHR